MKESEGQGAIQYVIIGLVVISLIGSWAAFAFAGKAASTEGLAKKSDVKGLKDRIATLRERIKALEEGQSSIMKKIGVKKPARLIVTSVSAPSIEAGETATITVSVANTGEKSGTKDLSLKIAGETRKTKSVTVAGGSSKTVTFSVPMAEAGEYRVSIAGAVTTLRVEKVAAKKKKPKKKKPWDRIKWNEPKSQVKRLGADLWIPPKGIKKIFEHVDVLKQYNSGGMKWDPATATNEKYFEEAIKEATGESIDIKIIEVPDDVLWSKALATYVGGAKEPTLIANSRPEGTGRQALASGFYEPIRFWSEGTPAKELVNKLGYPKDLVLDTLYTNGAYRGGVDTVRTHGFMYRPHWLKKAGVSEDKIPPTNWQDAIDAAKKAREWGKKHLGEDYYGIAFGWKGSINNQNIANMLYAMGAKELKNGKLNLKTEEFRKTIKTYVDLVKNDIAPTAVINWGWPDYHEFFGSGKAAIIPNCFSTYTMQFQNPKNCPGLWGQTMSSDIRSALGVEKGEKDWDYTSPIKWKPDNPKSRRGGFYDLDVLTINPNATDWKKAAAQVYVEFKSSKFAGMQEIWVEGNDSYMAKAFEDMGSFIQNYKDETTEWCKWANDKYNCGIKLPLPEKVVYPEAKKISAKYSCQEWAPPGCNEWWTALTEWCGKSMKGKVTFDKAMDKIIGKARELGILYEG